MKLLQLSYFRLLAEREHLYQTSMELYISPSALSAAISRLEDELGVKLFDRVGRNIRLNENGKKFYLHVSRALDELDTACVELKGKSSSSNCMLNVVTSTHVLWEEPFSEYILRNPHVSFMYRSLDVDRLESSGQAADCDFIITALNDIPSENYEYAILLNDMPVLVVWEGHPLANRKEISLAEVSREQFVMLPRNFAARRYADTLFELAGFTPNIVAEGDYSLRAKLIRDHVGITTSTVLGSKSIYLRNLRFLEIIEPMHPRVQAIFWKKGKQLSPQAKAFKNFMLQYYRLNPVSMTNQ